ncbi:hypothetical protein [Evansella cellulosilytica]|uniref:Uncharacterized protein n=1 Tax=Evansella cellulosilytica (strain ATCC 21833 / DSM 2522 / FERM P-1141 / JCM 9156 / N-4) TaxID=649639 RepID=E6TVH1_EVAC2|nr:hypothetical protein [Evansella cellulosilytica]ADU30988.1 hypothetical protein Bcell_2733 [Evansella cellulosilytica DSM 2522]
MIKYKDIIQDALLIIGFLLLCYGLWLIYPPIMFIIGGILLLKAGLPPVERKKGGGD